MDNKWRVAFVHSLSHRRIFAPKNKVFTTLLFLLLILNVIFWFELLNYSSIGQGIGQLGIVRCLSIFYIGFCLFHIFTYLKIRVSKNIGGVSLFCGILCTIFLGVFEQSNHFFIPICFAWILLSFLLSDTWLHQLLNKKVFVYLGDISYSLYLIHMFVITLYSTIFWDNEMIASLADLALIIAICLIASHFTYTYIEKPCRNAIVNRYCERNR